MLPTHCRELPVGERKQRGKKISPASSLYEKQETASKTDRDPAVKREPIRLNGESEDRT